MTREEFRDYVEFLRSQNEISYDVYSGLIDGIDTLEQEPILDKIRAEIEDLDWHYDNDYFSSNKDAMFKCDEVMQIIDKYKGESEENNAV